MPNCTVAHGSWSSQLSQAEKKRPITCLVLHRKDVLIRHHDTRSYDKIRKKYTNRKAFKEYKK
eukprot:CAMPEP_0172460102 /NCGR_PEP_ID=MMETSP1065-20121228/35523_1 /TAXON_ID=265537 /ORGANISM="Amphiprora paludosa, Strain CCMP125" /LENGTH=62 /DNA_ID=CAMNT_0013215027 /DNA_START=70 /DNA_END=255 /DNA_ORIENTATION=+